MKTLLERPRPGAFKATCRKGARLPVHELTEAERLRAEAESADLRDAGRYDYVFAWDRKRKVETALIPCSLDTTDRAEYLAHMERFHGRKPRGPAQVRRPKIRSTYPSAAPDEGRPFKPSAKAIAETVETCDGCGLVAEVNGTHAAEQWWREHLSLCTARADRGAA